MHLLFKFLEICLKLGNILFKVKLIAKYLGCKNVKKMTCLGGGEWKGNYPLERCILPEKFSWRCLDCCMCLIEGNKQGSAAASRNIKG